MSQEWKVSLLSAEAGAGSEEAEGVDEVLKREEEARAQGEIYWKGEDEDDLEKSRSPDASKSPLPEARDSEVSLRSSPIVLSTNRPQAGERAKERETQRDLPSGGRERERERQRERERSRGSRGEESGGRGTPNPFFETPRIPSTLSVFHTGSDDGRLLVSGGFASHEDLWESSEENTLAQNPPARHVEQHSHPHLFPQHRPRPPGLVASILIFVFGFACPPLWLLAARYLSSPSKKVRRLARASLLSLTLLCAVLLVFLFHRNPDILPW
mmetsp:Transcript_46590/g.110395  ORF Transcript_46590/g.110395 Transcript_46590/m.110395 type:complete len:270 (-) Transcript_46590:55-864(-)